MKGDALQNTDRPYRLLVLGASGSVGRLIRPALEKRASGQIAYQSRTVSDATFTWSINDSFEGFPKADAILSLWGAVPGKLQHMDMNTTLALLAQRVAEAVGADRIFHSSSAAVYAPSDEPLAEIEAPEPFNDYGKAKLAMEQAVLSNVKPGSPRPVFLRIGSFVGAESLFRSIAAFRKSKNPAPITLERFPDGHSARRSYIAPGDAANAVLALSAAKLSELPNVLNFGAPSATTMDALLNAANLPFQWTAARHPDRQNVVLDCNSLAGLTGLTADAADPNHLIKDWRECEALA